MTLYVFIVLFVLGITVYFYWIKKRPKPITTKTPYLDALHLMIDGKTDEALEQLKRTVNEDSDNIMAYIMLGNIFREKGFPIRATNVHRNLLLRNTLPEIHTDVILHHLVLDYRAAGMIEKAVETAERLSQRNKKNLDTKRLLLSLYEEKGDWDKAYFLRQSLNRWHQKRDQRILALYRVKSGLELGKKGAEREGRIRFREAIKLDKQCIPAYLYWGDSYRREQRDEDAYHVWLNFIKENPDWAHLAFDRMNSVLFDLKRYSETEGIYQDVMSKKPKNPTAYLNLIDIYKKRGKVGEALELCRQVIETNADSPRCRLTYIQLLQLKGKEGAALEETIQYLSKETEKQSFYNCSVCGNTSKEPLWHCPQCKQWNTYIDIK
jgi:lipopolysaccharide biosynthesis regulator YciM